MELDFGGGVEESGDLVIRSSSKHDFLKEVILAVSAAATVPRVFVVVEGVVGGLTEVAASENEVAEVEVEGIQK